MEDKKNQLVHSLNFGAIIGIAMVIYEVLLYFMGQTILSSSSLFTFVILIAGIYIATKNLRDEKLDGFINYSKALKYAIRLSFFVAIICAFYKYVFFKLIDPNAVTPWLEMTETAMTTQTNDYDKIDKAMELYRKYAAGILSVSEIINVTFFGTLFSLIICIFVKKTSGNPFSDAMKNIQ